jgi:hypothetical protein
MKLERWSIVSKIAPAFCPPEDSAFCLHGIVTGHPRYADGKEVRTSQVVHRRGKNIVTRSGHEYELGNANADYEMLFPNARERLLARLEACAAGAASEMNSEICVPAK